MKIQEKLVLSCKGESKEWRAVGDFGPSISLPILETIYNFFNLPNENAWFSRRCHRILSGVSCALFWIKCNTKSDGFIHPPPINKHYAYLWIFDLCAYLIIAHPLPQAGKRLCLNICFCINNQGCQFTQEKLKKMFQYY